MGSPYRPRDVRADADNTLSEYHARLSEAELRDQLDSGRSADQAPARHLSFKRALLGAFLWTIAVLAVAAVTAWFLDRTVAIEAVLTFTAIGIVTAVVRRRPAPQRGVAR